MTIHIFNGFTCNARWPSTMKTGMACLLVETVQGLVLVDTGPGLGDYAHPAPFHRFYQVITELSFTPTEAAANRIRELGFNPEDVHDIVLTHMHFDHCGGLPDFPRARVHVHQREYQAFVDGKIRRWDEFAYLPQHLAHKPRVVLYDKSDSHWYDFDAVRLPFEPEMYFIPLFGHSAGLCGVAIKIPSGWFFHASDSSAVYNHETPAWLIRLVLGPHDARLRAFMKTHPEVEVVNSHMMPEFFSEKNYLAKLRQFEG